MCLFAFADSPENFKKDRPHHPIAQAFLKKGTVNIYLSASDLVALEHGGEDLVESLAVVSRDAGALVRGLEAAGPRGAGAPASGPRVRPRVAAPGSG